MSDKYPGGFVTAGAPAGFSVAFDGTGDYLRTPTDAAFALGTSDFTFETWFYPVAAGNDGVIIDNRNPSGGTNGFSVSWASGSVIRVIVGAPNVWDIDQSTAAVSTNSWVHYALTRSGTTFRIFLNGALVYTSGSISGSMGTTAVYATLGAAYNASNAVTGYLSNTRLIKGTAVYTAAFTPPTQLFPITNTSLLTCQSPTIIDNSSNAFTITVAGDAKVSNFTPFAGYQGFNPALGAAAGGVWTLDEAAYYQQNRLWPIYDPYFNQTTLMLHGNGTNGAQNNTFLDSSVNNFTITRNGNTTQGTFTPFSQTGWSNFFSSSANYLVVPANSNFIWSTGARTYEAWVYVTSVAANNAIFGLTNLSTSNTWELYINTSSQVVFRYFAGSAQTVTTTGTVPLNAWAHVAFVYDGTSAITIYINGVASGTGTKTGTPVTDNNQLCIGRTNIGNAGDVFFSGYISNARFTTTTVYTSNFTPSNAPLTAVTGTTLLTCQDNRFVDDSANNATVTANGSVSVQAFSPFVPAYITPTTYSNYFSGSSAYLTAPNNAVFKFGTGDFTVEGWFYLPVLSGTYDPLFTIGDYTNGILMRYQNAGGSNDSLYIGGTASDWAPQTNFPLNRWNHVALVKNGTGSNNVKVYVNGISVLTITSSYDLQPTGLVYVGTMAHSLADSFAGVISNFRIVKGTAVYTANFTPPTAPLTNITNTSLLTCQSSTLIDNSTANSGSGFTITATGTVYPVTSPTPFPAKVDQTTLNSAYSTSLIGGGAYFDGTGDSLTVPDSATLKPGTGDFTWEAWLYPTAAGGNHFLFSQSNGSLDIYRNGSNKLVIDQAAIVNLLTSTNNIPVNTWTHYAFTRSGTTTRLFVNGVLDVSGTSSANLTNSNATSIGSSWPGYIASHRFVKGTAVYTANFAPPATPLTAITNTSLLLSATNGAIFDNTAKNVVETVNGAAISTTQSKYGGSSMYFDGTTDYLIAPANPGFRFGGADFTIEAWIYPTYSTTSGYNMAWHNNGSSTSLVTGSTLIPLNTWTHIAWSKTGTSMRFFINGVLDSGGVQTVSSIIYNNVDVLKIGFGADHTAGSGRDFCHCGETGGGSNKWFAYLANGGNGDYYGYIDDFRITTGVARYLANFTPPTSQLQDQ